MTKKRLSTFEREMNDPAFKKAFDESYKELALSELLISLMESDEKSVRKLAQEVGVSPTVIQNLRSGKQRDIKMINFISIVRACGYEVILQRGNDRFVAEEKGNNGKLINFVHGHI
jgi:DNA-binding Xre family transcriptional regulator